jgi:uncharacterized protein
VGRLRSRNLLIGLALFAGGLSVQQAPADHVHGGPDLFVTVSDGTSIAINVVFPKSFNPAKPGARKYPAIFEMAGYENGSSSDEGRTWLGETGDHCDDQFGNCPEPPLATDSHEGTGAYHFDDHYVSVHASVRGTGCSSGEFDLFSTRGALDGVEVIENWLVKQPWSNGKVGILGHSYSGNTGFMIAAMYKYYRVPTKHLVAVTVSGMIDDLYRGITYPGGVANYLFPPVWTLGVRPGYDVLGGSAQPFLRHGTGPIAQQCLANIATHRRNIPDDPVLHGIYPGTDGEWWHARSNIYYANLIDVPIHITGAFQDEQTGPRFPHLWEAVPRGIPKRLLMLNGDHGSQVGPEESWRDRKAWMDHWMRGVRNPYVNLKARRVSVRTLFEMHPTDKGIRSNGYKESRSFPLEDTRWTPFFLGPDGTLSRSKTPAGTASYLFATKREAWLYQAGPEFGSPVTTRQAPDELNFVSAPFTKNTAMAGPITASLFLASTAPDTALFVQVTDRDPAGNVSFLQRGVLKASHRAINPALSDWSSKRDPMQPSKRFLFRPWRPHVNPTDIVPLEVNEYLVEIFPVAHVFRPGHSLQIKILAPPWTDSYYAYGEQTAPALNTVHFGGATPSRITLPIVSLSRVRLGPPIACGEYHQVRCLPD